MSQVTRITCAAALLLALPTLCHAGSGLAAPHAERLWPQWQARINLHSNALAGPSLLSRAGIGAEAGSARGLSSASVLGDYYFARPFFGNFRASGGLLMGPWILAPLSDAAPGQAGLLSNRLSMSLGHAASQQPAGSGAADNLEPLPYLGLGYSGSLWHDRISLSADLGWVSERPSGAGVVGRALFGNQGMNQAWREMRLSPVVQLGMRYSF